MTAPQVFSPGRFARLARLQWQEQGRGWCMFALVLAVLLLLMGGVALSTGHGGGVMTGEQSVVYLAGLLLSGYLFAHQVLGVWRSREASLQYMMRPASTFEKWLLTALSLLLFYPLLYTAVFVAIYSVVGEVAYRTALAAAQASARAAESVNAADFATFVPFRRYVSEFPVLSSAAQLAWGLVYAALMAYAALGLVYFRRHAALRTLVTAIALLVLTLLLLTGISASVNPHALGAWLLSGDERLRLPAAALAFSWAVWAGVPLLLWASSYRALRERDLA